MKRSIMVLAMLAVVVGIAFAQEDAVNLEKIVITPYRYEEELARTASSTTIYGPSEIRDSQATNVLDVLRSVPGLVVRDWTGNATKASVDIRGFGEQSGMNVLVLVDGRRVNEVDLSGVDWTQVPLNQVERIEVTRGGNSVLYGDNAVAGVINIITKKGKGTPSVKLVAQGGSFDFNAQELSAQGAKEKLSYWASASRQSTHGYRNNSFYKGNDFSAKLGYALAEDFSLGFDSGYHYSTYGLPGALSGEDVETFGRRYSKYGGDHASQNDYYFLTQAKKEFDNLGAIDFDLSFRKKQVFTSYEKANAGWNPYLKSNIETYGINPKYTLDKQVFGKDNKFITGFDFWRFDTSYDTYSLMNALQDASDINKVTMGGYLQDELSLTDKLIGVGGFRYEAAKYEFDYHDNSGWFPAVDTNITPNQKAFNAGLIYNYMDGGSVFLNINRSFRFPATDEYFTWGSLNTQLEPQESRNYEAGIRHSFNPKFEIDLSVFTMDVKNELYYNPIGGPFGFGANENYDDTRRQGAELAYEAKLTKRIVFLGNYSYTKAVFKDGLYKDKDVPMVPRHKGSVGLKFTLSKNVSLNILGTYVGKRYFINDQQNSFSQINGYMTADTNISYAYKDLKVSAGISNLFDKEYSEFGVCNASTGAKNYYPNPGRSFNLKCEYTF